MREGHDFSDSDIVFVTIVCNGCGSAVLLSSDRPEAWETRLSGWHVSDERPYEDLCPECR